MTNQVNALKSNQHPMRALDAEEWRMNNGLTIGLACELLGLQRAKWTSLMNEADKNPTAPLDDMAVCILLTLYRDYPETMPIGRVVDITEFMKELGYNPENPAHKKEFAILMGREPAASYRWVQNVGNISKPIERIVAAVQRLDEKSGRGRKYKLKQIVEKVAHVNGISDPFKRATWRTDQRPNGETVDE